MTIADLENQVTEAVLGFEQHGFGVPVLLVHCNPEVGEPVYFPPCTADPNRSAERSRRSLALVLWPDGWLTQEALVEATRLYLRCSGEWGPVRGEDVVIHRWSPFAPWNGATPETGLRVWLGEDKVVCSPVQPAPVVGLQEYLDACVQALRANNPVGWPAYAENPLEVWRYLARSIGYGLGCYDVAAVRREIGSLYGRIVVACTFGTRYGVPIDNATFLGWMREAAAEARRMEVNVRDG